MFAAQHDRSPFLWNTQLHACVIVREGTDAIFLLWCSNQAVKLAQFAGTFSCFSLPHGEPLIYHSLWIQDAPSGMLSVAASCCRETHCSGAQLDHGHQPLLLAMPPLWPCVVSTEQFHLGSQQFMPNPLLS